jgi:hypothetical protein
MSYENLVIYDRDPESYKHWSLDVDGDIATLTLTVDEDGGIRPGYKLKLNSYDLGVDMELHDALQRVRFEHPTVKTVVVTSGLDRMFCAGAIWSTKFHSLARLPRTPSVEVQNTSARSRRILRLSVKRVSPPVPGSTPSRGTSGRLTALERSSIRKISSQAKAIS